MSTSNNTEKQIRNLDRMLMDPGHTEDFLRDLRQQRAALVAKVPGGCKKTVEHKETLQLHDFLEDGYVYNTALHVYPSEKGVREYEYDENAEGAR